MTNQQSRLPHKHPLWGELHGGPYGVSFKSCFRYDYARVYDQPLSGPQGLSAKKYRPILINIWYPVHCDDAGAFLPYREYLTIGQNHVELRDFCEKLIAFHLDVISQEVMYKPHKDLSQQERAIFENFLNTETAVLKESLPCAGRFPLVINHQGLGGSFEDNAVLFEFLASHGYVVANSAYQSENAAYFNVDWDLVRSIKDMEFLVNSLQDHPSVEKQKVAVMGQSYGGQAAMAWRAEENSAVDAVISFDSTLEYAALDEPGFAKLKERLARVDNLAAPLLVFASRRGKPNFDHYEALKYAPRYFAMVEHLLHNDYISHGAIGSGIRLTSPPGAPPDFVLPEPKLVQESYELVCLYTLKFLDAYLKGDQSALEFLRKSAEGVGVDASRLSLQFEDAIARPPTAKQLADMILERGVEATLELCRQQGHELELAPQKWTSG